MKVVLEVNKLKKSFWDFKAVKGISFNVSAGEVLGIIGPNGAGKTTTIKMILGLLNPDQGTIKLFGKDLQQDSKIKSRLGYMPETPSFYAHLTGKELLHFVGEIFGIPSKILAVRTQKILEEVGLKDAANRQLGGYSKGMLQRICLAQALINEPELLFLDEPLDGLDPLGRIRMKEILLKVKEGGTAIVFNSHILSDVELMSDRIAIMDKGEILKIDTVQKMVPRGNTLEEVFIKTITDNSKPKKQNEQALS